MIKRIASLVLLLTFALSAFAQTAEKTFTKAFNATGKSRISFDLPGPIDLKVWDSSTIRIEITIHLPSGSMSVLDQLANVGRYNLEAKTSDETIAITAPNLHKLIRIKGEELKEQVSYIVFVPKDTEVELHGAVAMADVKK